METTTLKGYLEEIRDKLGENNPSLKKYYSWILDTMQEMTCEELTPEEKKHIQKIIDVVRNEHPEFPANKECYYNANLLTCFGKGKVKYVEGWCWDVIPFEHAWCKYKGKCFDPTALWNERWHKDIQYFGRQIPFKQLVKLAFEDKMHEIVSIIGKLYREECLE